MRSLALPLLLLTVIVVYWPGLAGDFMFDDFPNIVGNPSLRVFDGSLASLLEASRGATASPLGRPLSMATFALNLHYADNGAFGFKLVNLLIHLVNGVLIYLLARQLWPRLVGDARTEWAAFWIAALWLLHPINLTPVLFVVQRMTELATLFTLAALILYLHGRQSQTSSRWWSLAASLLVCWPAGILSKETALLLPLFLLLCEMLVLDGFRRMPPRWRYLAWMAALSIAIAVVVAYWPMIENSYRFRDFTLYERLLTEARVLWLYVGQMLMPWPDLFSLHHDDIEKSRSLFEPPLTTVAVAAWGMVLAAALWQSKTRPWLSFGILWFLAGHLLESSLLGLDFAYEHRNYLPTFGPFLGLAAVLLPAPTSRAGKVPRLVFACGCVALCGLMTGLRAAQWGNEYVRTQIEANTHPASARTHLDAARAILARQLPTGEISSAAYHMTRIHYQRAAQFDAQNKTALAGILYLDCAVAARPDREVWQALLERLARTRFTPGDEGFVQSLSDMLAYNLLCLDDAGVEALLAAALANPTATARIRGMLHAVAMDYAVVRRGSLQLGRQHALAAVEADPGSAVLRINLIRVLLQLDETEEARRQYAILARLRIPAASRKEVENLGLGLGK